MSYGSGVLPSRTKTKSKSGTRSKQNQRRRDSSDDDDDEHSSSSDDEPPKPPPKPKRKAVSDSTDEDASASSGDDRRKRETAKVRKTGGGSKVTKERPKRSKKKREVSSDSGSSTDDRGYTNKSQAAQRASDNKKRKKWADANGRENMTKRERNRKPGGRVRKTGAFPGKGHSLVDAEDMSDDQSTYRRQAGSRNAREARAIAAESRTDHRDPRPAVRNPAKKPGRSKPRESSDDEPTKLRKKARATTDSENIDDDSDAPPKKYKSVLDNLDPELRELIGGNTSDSEVDQLEDSDEDLPTLRQTATSKKTTSESQPAIKKSGKKSEPVASGSGRSGTASREHRDVPIPAKQKRAGQRFFSNAENEEKLKRNLATNAAERRNSAVQKKAEKQMEIWSDDDSDVEGRQAPQAPRVALQPKPAKSASKAKASADIIINISDSDPDSD